jgi:hypothetical protein
MYLSWVSLRLDFVNIFYKSPMVCAPAIQLTLVDVYLRLGQLYFTRVPGNIAGVFNFLLVELGVFLRDIAVTAAQLVFVIIYSTGLLSDMQSLMCCMTLL